MRTVTWLNRSTRGVSQVLVSNASFDGEVLADGVRPGTDATGVVSGVPFVDHGVELLERAHLRDRDEVVAAEPADLTFDAALLMGSLDAWLAVERVDGDPR